MILPDFLKHMKESLLLEKMRLFVLRSRVNKLKTVEELKADNVPVDVQYDFKFDPIKGSLSYLVDRKMPMRIYPIKDSVAMGAVFKKIIPYGAKEFHRANILEKIFMILSMKRIMNLFIDITHNGLTPYFLKQEYYSQIVREIYRVLDGLVDDKIRDIVCFYAEYDAAYRYRLQDILACLNKEALKKDYKKELKRLLDILCERESYACKMEDWGMANKYIKIFKLVSIFLLLKPKFKKTLVKVLSAIDLKEIALSDEDIYWTNFYEDYNFRGMNYDQREADNKARFGNQRSPN
jgi:hypothetical protein